LTDLCEYCEKEVFLKKKIAQLLEQYNYKQNNNLKINEIKNFFHERSLTLKKQISISSNENLETNYNQIKSIIDDLRDYEVKINDIFFP
jgi:hypothetical protein